MRRIMKHVLALSLLAGTLLLGRAIGQRRVTTRWEFDERPVMELKAYDKYYSDMGSRWPAPDAKLIEHVQLGLRSDGVVVWRSVR